MTACWSATRSRRSTRAASASSCASASSAAASRSPSRSATSSASTTSAARRFACRWRGSRRRRLRSPRPDRPPTRPPAADGEVRTPRRRRKRRQARLPERRPLLAREVPRRARRGRPVGGPRPDHRARRALVDHRRQARRPAAISLTWKHVRARRLARGALTERSPSLVDVARRTGGIHAQVQASAELQLASRVEGSTQQDVRDALWRDRTLVKAWTLRGTLHLHPAEEVSMWLAARRAVEGESPDGLKSWLDPKGVVHPAVSPDELTEIQAAVWDSFAGRALLRDELAAEVVRRVGKKH